MEFFEGCCVRTFIVLLFYNLITSVVNDLCDVEKTKIKLLRLFNIPIIILGLTCFLWGPWLSFCMDNIHKWNMNILNDLEKKEKVLPAEEPVRESKEKEL